MSGELHLDRCAVQVYLNHNAPVEWNCRVRKFLTMQSARQAAAKLNHNGPVEWDCRVRKFLTRQSARQAAAKLLEPRSRRNGTDVHQ